MKKFLPYIIIILIILAGISSPIFGIKKAEAATTCKITTTFKNPPNQGQVQGVSSVPDLTNAQCTQAAKDKTNDSISATAEFTDTSAVGGTTTTTTTIQGQSDPSAAKDGLENHLPVCQWNNFTIEGCLADLFYYIFISLASFILSMSGMFFNAMVAIGLSSKMYAGSSFIPNAWGVVRDLSNIFFILALLYVAIRMILDIGGHDTKKTVAQVIIMALLINFSMFFTEVVIDSSNVLALVFYNKINVETLVDKTPRAYIPATNANEKDISGGFTAAFNPSKLLSKDFFDKASQPVVASYSPTAAAILGPLLYNGVKAVGWIFGPKTEIPTSLIIGITFISGLIMIFAAYAFFVAGISFLSRLIELWVLIIFSPFAFMSSAVPFLKGIPDIGWEDWTKRLLKASFMAPIFMFFMYAIFLIINGQMFNNIARGNATGTNNPQTWTEILLFIIIAALISLTLLLKASRFAKKSSGAIGEMVFSSAKMVGGLALGAATGGAAMLGTGLIGGAANKLMGSKLGANLRTRETAGGLGGFAAKMALRTANYGTKATFDVRKAPGIGALAKMGGINMEAKAIGMGAKEGGYMQKRKEKEEKRQKRAKELEVREDEPLKQKLNHSEIDLQVMLNKVAKDFGNIDRELEGLRKAKADAATGSTEERDIAVKIKDLNDAKKAVKSGAGASYTIDGVTKTIAPVSVTSGVNAGKTMKEMATNVIPEQQEAISTENRERKISEAHKIEKKWLWRNTNRAAAHKIIMEAKLPESSAKS